VKTIYFFSLTRRFWERTGLETLVVDTVKESRLSSTVARLKFKKLGCSLLFRGACCLIR